MKYEHIKTGNLYKVLNTVLLKENGKWVNVIIYEKLGELGPIFARHELEFYEKFRQIK